MDVYIYIYIYIYDLLKIFFYNGVVFTILLPRAFRDPSESSASVNCIASDKLPRTFRAKRPYAQKKNICFREASVNLPSKAGSWTVDKDACLRHPSEDLPSQAPLRKS